MSPTAAALKTEVSSAKVPTHQIPINELFLAKEAPKGANLEVRDSGAGSPMTDEELKASLYAKGVIYPLMFKEYQGKKYTVVGNRRLRMLREIFVDAKATTVKCENIDDYGGDWREIAIDTNLSLPPHMVERYEMIVALAKDQKLSEKEVCARFGMSDMQYRRVMALGKMAPAVRQAWKAAEIDAKTAQLFTLEPDAKKQEEIYNAVKKGGRGVSHWEVKNRIVPRTQSQDAAQKIAFIGVEAARKAKVLKQEDLFSGENHIVSDAKMLNRLVDEKMKAACDELVKAGWGWAYPKATLPGHEHEYSDVHPDSKKAVATPEEKARLARLEQLTSIDNEDEDYDFETGEDEIEAIYSAIASRGFTDEQRKRAGCILRIGHNGELQITYGKVKPADKKKVAAAEKRETPSTPKKAKKPGEVTLSNALASRLAEQLEKGMSEAMVASPYVALAGMIAGFATAGEIVAVDVSNRDAAERYKMRGGSEKNFLQVFAGALKMSPEHQAAVLAGIASKALNLHTFNAANMPMSRPGVQALAEALPKEVVNAKIRAHFDIANYFESVDHKTCVEAVRCALGDGPAAEVAKMKKAAAAKFAASHLKNTLYVPPALRTAHYEGPVEKAPAKPERVKKTPKKKAKAKK